jgi:hypothetical protein
LPGLLLGRNHIKTLALIQGKQFWSSIGTELTRQIGLSDTTAAFQDKGVQRGHTNEPRNRGDGPDPDRSTTAGFLAEDAAHD